MKKNTCLKGFKYMKKLKISDVVDYVEKNIGTFHRKRLQSLTDLKLEKILKRKNPYLYKAKNILTAHDLVKELLDAHLSSQEETIFGKFLEGLAIFICSKIYGGSTSLGVGVDLEFVKDGVRYIVDIKSGPNWGNSSQIQKMLDNFRKAKKILGLSAHRMKVVAVNGCCYGIDDKPEKEEYLKLCGQRFWEFISGDENLYTEIIEPLGHKAKERNEEFVNAYSEIINKFTLSFSQMFCVDGKIDWGKIVQFNSAQKKK